MADYDLHEFTARFNSMISDYQTKIANFGADELPFYKLGLSPLQQNILIYIATEGPKNMTEIVERFNLYRAYVTRPVGQLVDMGILERFQKDGNRRSIYLTFTENGKAMVKTQGQAYDKKVSDFLESMTPEFRKRFIDAVYECAEVFRDL